MSKVADNLALYRRVLLAITELGDGTVDCQEQIMAGISYYAHMAYGTAPSEELAEKIIDASLRLARDMQADDEADAKPNKENPTLKLV